MLECFFGLRGFVIGKTVQQGRLQAVSLGSPERAVLHVFSQRSAAQHYEGLARRVPRAQSLNEVGAHR